MVMDLRGHEKMASHKKAKSVKTMMIEENGREEVLVAEEGAVVSLMSFRDVEAIADGVLLMSRRHRLDK